MLKKTKSSSFDADKLAALKTHLDNQYLNKGWVAGYSYLIAQHGEIAALEFNGKSAMGEEADKAFPVDQNTLFRIYSMTKPITSLMLMMLVEQGKVTLQDDVKKYIPAFANPQIWVDGDTSDYTTRPADRDITLHDLVTHQSGLTYDFIGEHPIDALYRRKRLTGARNTGHSLEEFCDELAALPLRFPPGTAWNYSVGLDIIGRVIEIVTGQSLDKASRDMVFEPLGMHDTDYQIAANKTDRFMHCYYNDPVKKVLRCVDHPEKSHFAGESDFCGGGGGLISSLPDYYRFLQMLRNKGALDGVRLISEETYKQIMSNQLNHGGELAGYAVGIFSENGVNGNGFGIGGSVVTNHLKTDHISSMGNFSWGGLAGTYFWIDPIEDMIVIFMTQLMPYSCIPLREEFTVRLYDALGHKR